MFTMRAVESPVRARALAISGGSSLARIANMTVKEAGKALFDHPVRILDMGCGIKGDANIFGKLIPGSVFAGGVLTEQAQRTIEDGVLRAACGSLIHSSSGVETISTVGIYAALALYAISLAFFEGKNTALNLLSLVSVGAGLSASIIVRIHDGKVQERFIGAIKDVEPENVAAIFADMIGKQGPFSYAAAKKVEHRLTSIVDDKNAASEKAAKILSNIKRILDRQQAQDVK
jgi:hypothetical protein